MMQWGKRMLVLFFGASLLAFGPILSKTPQAAGKEETIVGFATRTDKGIVIEAEDGNYLVKGKDLSKMVGKMVEATGVITESEKGDFIEVKFFEEVQE